MCVRGKRTWEARQLKRICGRAFPFFYLVWGGEGDNWIAEQRTPVKYDSPGHTHHHQPTYLMMMAVVLVIQLIPIQWKSGEKTA